MIQRRTADVVPSISLFRLWFGVAAAPIAWTLAFSLGYGFSAARCMTRSGDASVGNFALGLSFAMLVLALAGMIVSLTNWREIRHMVPPPPGDVRVQQRAGVIDPLPRAPVPWWGRSRFMAVGGLFGSAVFALGIVLFGIGTLLVQPCSPLH